ncbi:hypothetical protein [Pedobacter sp. Hv1]|uniref:hypothetical protein n=1 Tax=Pedobacter sp. Hv1 TaxID=1740090 RepID=UPI000AE49FAE|nr:hypothetical protein [Pedobacter sp. Hv1]
MAILHRKEEKIQAVLGRLPKNYTDEDFVSMFIKLYSKDWGKIKAAYIKQAQDKEPGTVINMPKPDLYLKQLAEIYIKANPPKAEVIKEEVKTVVAPTEKVKKVAVKKAAVTKENADVVELQVEKVKKTAVKKDTIVKVAVAEPKVKKASAKKNTEVIETPVEAVKKVKAVTKKKEVAAETPTVKKKAVAKK